MIRDKWREALKLTMLGKWRQWMGKAYGRMIVWVVFRAVAKFEMYWEG